MAEKTGSSFWTGNASFAVAAALADLGRQEEATAMLSKHADHVGSVGRHRFEHLRRRLALDTDPDAGSALDVEGMLADWDSQMTGLGRLADVMVDALLACGRLENAEEVASRLEAVRSLTSSSIAVGWRIEDVARSPDGLLPPYTLKTPGWGWVITT